MIEYKGRIIRGVLFDMDGVIADTRDAHCKAWQQFAEREGVQLDMDDFMRKTFGRGNDQVFCIFYNRTEPDVELFRRKGAEKEQIFLDLFKTGEVPAVAGLHDFLAHLRRARIARAVGSSAPRGNITAVLSAYDIADYFPVTVSMEDVHRAKPDPEIFTLCVERLGLAPEECVVLEDSIHGLEAARAAGCQVVGITTMHPPEEIAHLCDYSVPDFVELTKLWFGEDAPERARGAAQLPVQGA